MFIVYAGHTLLLIIICCFAISSLDELFTRLNFKDDFTHLWLWQRNNYKATPIPASPSPNPPPLHPMLSHYLRYWSPVNSHHKGQWRGALMFSLICAWINVCVNNRGAGDLRHHRAHYYIIVMFMCWCLVVVLGWWGDYVINNASLQVSQSFSGTHHWFSIIHLVSWSLLEIADIRIIFNRKISRLWSALCSTGSRRIKGIAQRGWRVCFPVTVLSEVLKYMLHNYSMNTH